MFTEEPVIGANQAVQTMKNEQGLNDVWNYLRCLSSKTVNTSRYVYIVGNGVDDTPYILIPKSDFPTMPDPDDIDVYVIENSTQATQLVMYDGDVPSPANYYTLGDADPDWKILFGTSVAYTYTVVVKVLKKENFDDLFICAPL